MSTIEDLHPSSFRGVSFLWNSETKNGGKKTVSHEYVNNNKRFTEELGEIPPKFTMQVIVHGEDAIQRRLDLERVLNIPGLGTLVHPVYGSIEVKSTIFSVSSTQKDIGRFDFSINFESSEENITLTPDLTTNSAVSGASEQARASLFNALEDNYLEPQIPDTVDSSAGKLTDMLGDINSNISSTVGVVQDNVASFTKVVNEALTEVFTTVQQGVKLKSSLEAVYSSALSVVSTPQDLYKSWLNLTSFGLDDKVGELNTVYRVNKENDLSVMNEHTRINALVNLYESTTYREFGTDQELQNAIDILDQLFTKLMRNFNEDTNTELNILAKDQDVRQKMSDLRTISRKVIEQKEKNIWKVVTIDPGFSSMALVSYRYYGSLDNLDLIKTLNNDVNWSNSNEELQAVSQ